MSNELAVFGCKRGANINSGQSEDKVNSACAISTVRVDAKVGLELLALGVCSPPEPFALGTLVHGRPGKVGLRGGADLTLALACGKVILK
ncbi:hypothetical protein BM221_002428 [Beauveria bassiana]|uniref:Uncharacterized protein n=1 Tax=Beauveria bassiana TaxID=176275 RepID=A0A2N6NYH4_BEABA|nr:hypothetical protein BM221_002428 [Beauveria bassiana]